jgi:hypothetical protein
MMLNLYSFFHLNLMYSSIEESARKDVIDKCYWPLFHLADMGIPIGIEAPAVTLEIINDIDPAWITALAKYISEEKIEFIGSGYSQLIGPLVPAKVNDWNQGLGIDYYQNLLNIKPKIALVNEMAYSGGIVEHYSNVDYGGLIMEWNNPRFGHPNWNDEWRYYAQTVVGGKEKTMPLIWADSLAFQKFQRYAHGEIELTDYIKYLTGHLGKSDRYFPLYSNDVEIFDYRPGRYQTETKFDEYSEWDRIFDLYKILNSEVWCEFVFPSQGLKSFGNQNERQKLKLESPAQPIPVKKQEKYNINRWALTGRDDMAINTKCYKIYNSLLEDGNNNSASWRELCYLWSSDFRTHITENRWIDYIKRLELRLTKINRPMPSRSEISLKNTEVYSEEVYDDKKSVRIENGNYKIVLNKFKGLTIKELAVKQYGDEPLLGTLIHGYYDDISLGADYYSGHSVVEIPGEHKITDLSQVNPIINKHNNYLSIRAKQNHGNYSFDQRMEFRDDNLIIKKNIQATISEKSIIRTFSFTFNPEVWDRNTLYVATHNGGSDLEKFYVKDHSISHSDIYSSLISARHGFGNTEGIVIIGDKEKSITFTCEMSLSALIPSIVYKEMTNTYFFRLQYSAREMDETMRKNKVEIRSQLAILFNHVKTP